MITFTPIRPATQRSCSILEAHRPKDVGQPARSRARSRTTSLAKANFGRLLSRSSKHLLLCLLAPPVDNAGSADNSMCNGDWETPPCVIFGNHTKVLAARNIDHFLASAGAVVAYLALSVRAYSWFFSPFLFRFNFPYGRMETFRLECGLGGVPQPHIMLVAIS
jgi:hypothetical protein